MLEELRALMADARYTEVVARVDAAAPEIRQAPALLLLKARALHLSEHPAPALAVLAEAAARGAEDKHVLPLRRAIQFQLKDDAGLAETLLRLTEVEPGNQNNPIALARLYLRQGDAAAAALWAQRILDAEPGNPVGHSLRYQAAQLAEDLDAVIHALQTAIRDASELPALPMLWRYISVMPRQHMTELTAGLSARWPECQPPGESAVRQAPQDDAAALRKAYQLALEGAADAAQACVAPLADRPDALTLNLEHSLIPSFLAAIPGPKARRRGLAVDDGTEIFISPRGDSDVAVLLFAGLGDGTPAGLQTLDSIPAAHGHTTIYVRDFARVLFLSGIAALAPDRAGTVVALRHMLDDLGARRLFVVGTSGGGFAAIAYGLALGADRIIGCSGPSCILPEFLAQAGDKRGQIVARRLQALFPAADLDLRDTVIAGGGRCPITLYYGEHEAVDTAHARHLAGLPGVQLHPIAGYRRHPTTFPLIASGEYHRILSP